MFREDPPDGCGCLLLLAVAAGAMCIVSNRCGSRWHRLHQFAGWVRHVWR